MKTYKISAIGEFHINHNEDAVAVTEIGKDKVLLAVMDGCSMGTESHFASTLIAKLLRKIAKEISYRAFAERTERSTSEYLKETLKSLFNELGQLKNQLHLEREEVLSTLILGILDKQSKAIELIIIGDGLICYNGAFIEYEQDDKPDYLGYHLEEDFESWYQDQTQKLSLKNIYDISMASDGIFTFKNFDAKEYPAIAAAEITEYLLVDHQWGDKENMLKKKLSEIERKFGKKPSDDLTIVRIRL